MSAFIRIHLRECVPQTCWDLNGIGDPFEDKNGDGTCDALDCQAGAGTTGGTGVPFCGQGIVESLALGFAGLTLLRTSYRRRWKQ